MAGPDPSLVALRAEIDRIDAAMHDLLIERGEIIGRLIAVKRTAEMGSAFRPAREAEMMRRLVMRHRGILPLDTAESILRVIIATFTYIQAPFRLHADLSDRRGGDARLGALPFRLHRAVRRPSRRVRRHRRRCRPRPAISAWCRRPPPPPAPGGPASNRRMRRKSSPGFPSSSAPTTRPACPSSRSPARTRTRWCGTKRPCGACAFRDGA